MTRDATIRGAFVQRKIRIGMTGETCACRAPDRRLVRMHVIALSWTTTCGMAVYATRIREYFADLGKKCA
jgi:hypothetical protein